MANRSEYWNPKNETLTRDELRALQHIKLKRLCEWAYAKSGFHQRRWDAAKFHPDQLRTVDDLERPIAGRRRRRRVKRLQVAADHQPYHSVVADASAAKLADDTAVAQHDHPIGAQHELVQAV